MLASFIFSEANNLFFAKKRAGIFFQINKYVYITSNFFHLILSYLNVRVLSYLDVKVRFNSSCTS